MSVKVERYAFRIIQREIDADDNTRASSNLRLFMDWSQAHRNEEVSYFGQRIFRDETMDAIRAAIMTEDSAQHALATLSSFSA